MEEMNALTEFNKGTAAIYGVQCKCCSHVVVEASLLVLGLEQTERRDAEFYAFQRRWD